MVKMINNHKYINKIRILFLKGLLLIKLPYIRRLMKINLAHEHQL